MNTDKTEIKISYDLSGVKMLKIAGVVVISFGIICALASLDGFLTYIGSGNSMFAADESIKGLQMLSTYLPITVMCLIGGPACLGLSSIVKVVLYKKALIERDYTLIDGNTSLTK